MNVLITGVSGLLGNNLSYYFREKAKVTGVYRHHPVAIPGVETSFIDLCDYPATRQLVETVQPDVIIHCASRTDVDGIESDREGGWQANVWATKVLLDACRDSKARFIYISTDAVYPGVRGPYSENTETQPCNWYGGTKLEAEKFVSLRPGSLILRTNIFGWNIQDKESLAEWFLNRLVNAEHVKGFSDAIFSSIYTFSFAAILEHCLEKKLVGTYNCGSSDSCSKYEFGCRLAELFGYDSKRIDSITLTQASLHAARGRDLAMDVHRLTKALGQPLPTLDECLQQYFQDWRKGLPQTIKKNRGLGLQNCSFPKREYIPYGCQNIDNDDIEAVVTTLKSPYLTQGPEIGRFEKKLSEIVNSEYTVAVNSGTSALHLACLAAGVTKGDEVITSPNTFVASANCALYCGARPVFVDIDPSTFNILPEEIEKNITDRTKAVIPVHFAGQSCQMEAIHRIVKSAEKKFGHKIFIIEDGCHALGSVYSKRKVGSCKWSDLTVFSFHPVKHITTGEGGAITTNDPDLYNSLCRYRSHGITSRYDDLCYVDQAVTVTGNDGQTIGNPWYYEQQELGYNYRLTDLQASLGVSQLEKLDDFKKKRRQIVAHYNEAFGLLENVHIPYESSACDSNFHLYVLLFDFQALSLERAEMMKELKEQGILTQVHYIPVHTHPYYQKTLGTRWGDCPNAEKYYRRCLSIPLFQGLDGDGMNRVINQITRLTRG